MILNFGLDLPCKTSLRYDVLKALLVVGYESIKMTHEDKYQQKIFF